MITSRPIAEGASKYFNSSNFYSSIQCSEFTWIQLILSDAPLKAFSCQRVCCLQCSVCKIFGSRLSFPALRSFIMILLHNAHLHLWLFDGSRRLRLFLFLYDTVGASAPIRFLLSLISIRGFMVTSLERIGALMYKHTRNRQIQTNISFTVELQHNFFPFIPAAAPSALRLKPNFTASLKYQHLAPLKSSSSWNRLLVKIIVATYDPCMILSAGWRQP